MVQIVTQRRFQGKVFKGGRVAAGFRGLVLKDGKISQVGALRQGGADFIAGKGPPLRQLNKNTLQDLERHFKRSNDSRLKQTQELIQQRLITENRGRALQQERLARGQAAKRKFDEGVQASQPDRFDKIIADTQQRDKVRAAIINAGFDPADLRQASGRFVDKITTNEIQREQARFQASIPISQRPAQITGRSQPKEGETIVRSSELNQPKEFTLSLKESLDFSDDTQQRKQQGIPKTSAGFLRGAPVGSEL